MLPQVTYNPPVPTFLPTDEVKNFAKRNHMNITIDTIKEALTYLEPEEYTDWIQGGMCIKSAFPSEDGEEVWLGWSKRSAKYDEKEARKKWASFKCKNDDKVLSIGTLIWKAKQAGWEFNVGYSSPYGRKNGKYILYKTTRNFIEEIEISNFTAQITEEVVHDDGATKTRVYTIVGNMADRRVLPALQVPAKDFSAMNWVPDQWGASAIISAGRGMKDHLAAAIQTYSKPDEKMAYKFTGWHEINGIRGFLHANGFITAEGCDDTVHTDLPGKIQEYKLATNEKATNQNVRHAVKESINLLKLAPPNITVPLLGAAYRAPLGYWSPSTLSVFCVGGSGTFKSAIAGVILSHYGSYFDGDHLTNNWTSTANELEHQTHMAKDVLYAVDDYVPQGEAYQTRELRGKAERLFRSQGNQSGRGRMNQNCESRPEYYPRGIIIATGEDVPAGQSLMARIVTIEFNRGDVDVARLTEAQKLGKDGVFEHALSNYLRFIAQNQSKLTDLLDKWQQEFRQQVSSVHTRIPGNLSALYVGWCCFLMFAETCGAISAEEADETEFTVKHTLLDMIKAQDTASGEEDVVVRYVDLIRQALASSRAYLSCPLSNHAPERPEVCGWKQKIIGTSDGPIEDWDPRGDRIGWVNNDGDVWLMPEASFGVAERMAREQNKSLGFDYRTLGKRMAERGILLSHDKGRNTKTLAVCGSKTRGWHLSTEKILGYKVNTNNSQ